MRHRDIQRQGASILIRNPAVDAELPPWLFDPEALDARGLIRATSQGRRHAWFIVHDGRDLVLRHYWRGGMIAVFSRDVYLWTGLARARPVAEYRLLAALRERGLPVPEPVAARVRRDTPLTYRGDLITRALPGTRSLADGLRAGDGDDALWARVGHVVARFHRAGADHADLNVRNILVDTEGRVWIIDWDRGRLDRPHRRLRRNVDRLRRSFSREPDLERLAVRHWPTLRRAYERGLQRG